MNFISPLASLLGLELDHVTDRIKHAVVINAVMIGCIMLAAGFLIAAGFMALAQVLGGIYAALVLAGAFLLFALAVYAGMRIGEGRRKREIAERRRTSETGAFLTSATLAALPMLLRSPLIRNIGLPAAAVAALVLFNRDNNDDEGQD